MSIRTSVRPDGTTKLPLDRFSWNFEYFWKSVTKIQASLTSNMNNWYFTGRPTKTFLITSWSILLGMRNVSDKSGRENQNTHFMFSNFFFLNCAVYEIMWKNIVELDRLQMRIWCISIAFWIPKATHTHTHTHTLEIYNT